MVKLFLFLFSAACWAHPVPYKGAVAVNSMNQSFQQDQMVAYSFKRDTAIAARIMSFDDNQGSMRFWAPQINRLIKRWNGENSQSNVYFSGAVGPMDTDEHQHSAILTGVAADSETRQLFASAAAEKMWTGIGSGFWHVQSRLGAAPYAAGFNQLATWLMVQYDYNPLIRGWDKVTPLVRLFYRNYLLEAGVSTEGDWLVNAMVHL